MHRRIFLKSLLGLPLLAGQTWAAPKTTLTPATPQMQKRWLFIWRDMSDPAQVERTIALFPQAQADGYNAVVFGSNVAPSKAAAFRQAAKQHGLGLVAMVMGDPRNRNNYEGFPVQDALFVVKGNAAAFQPDNPTKVVNGDFEDVGGKNGNHFNGWAFQDSEDVSTFADHTVVHSGKTSLRMENVTKNPGNHCRIEQPITLQPHRQYLISFWVKTQNLVGIAAEVELLTTDGRGISYQTFHTAPTQDWTRYVLGFNSLDNTQGSLYLGTWSGTSGTFWWDDLRVDEVGLLNVLRRPGCPVTVRGEDGTDYTEGQDFEPIVDPLLNPWQSEHTAPTIRLTTSTRIKDGQRLRVSYYHPVIIYEDRINGCLSEPAVFQEWADEVKSANALYHPDAFFMQHDEIREMNQCASCQAMHKTPGELLAWNVHKAAGIIRAIRPDAAIWVWNDMFDPMHNAKDHYYLVNGPLAGSWKGLDPGIGIVNWNGGAMGKDCPFFANLGLRQILSGYYDGDNDGSKIVQWEAAVQHVPGIVGAMYTTWDDNYGPMDTWAKRAWGSQRATPI